MFNPVCCGSQGANYRRKAGGARVGGSVALVLGAGNQTPVACLDILHKLLVDDAVVVCKMNPVNEYLGAYIRCAGTSRLALILRRLQTVEKALKHLKNPSRPHADIPETLHRHQKTFF